MGRSVYTPALAIAIGYIHTDIAEQYEWEDLEDDLRSVISERFKSFARRDENWRTHEQSFSAQEGTTILENGHARVVIAEYCGIVSISLVPKGYYGGSPELAEAWCRRVGTAFEELIQAKYTEALTPVGTGSNGVTMYQKAGA